MTAFSVNGKSVTVDAAPDMPLLWALRDSLGYTGVRFGCGVASCGACTVYFNGAPTRACVLPLAAVAGAEITTIEGIDAAGGDAAAAVKTAWAELQVPQCGWCQSGQIMSAVSLLSKTPPAQISDEVIDREMNGNVCRCATYTRIRAAIHRAGAILEEKQA